jgi:uncharacterized protein (TIGR02145 family)
MKNLIIILSVIVTTITSFPQKMVVQKTDGTNMFLDMNTIETINFIIPCPGTPTVDYEGKTYNTVLIGEQCWLKENLDVGTQIVHGQYPGNNSIIEKYCYNDLPANCETYGGLYLWNEAMQYVTTEGARGICPEGWHMPKASDVQALIDYFENDGNSLKREDQGTVSGQGTNISGFGFLLTGGKEYSGGYYSGLGEVGRMYVGKNGNCGYSCAYSLELYATNNNIYFNQGIMPSWGVSVRCVKD